MEARIAKEVKALAVAPPPGVAAWPAGEGGEAGAPGASLRRLTGEIAGPAGSPYAGGVFVLDVRLPERYPFEPPAVRFVTPVYHPNVDTAGRICLDLLNMPPKGAWKPSLNVSTVLQSIGLLLEDANPDDPLMTDVASEFKHNRALFDAKAREHTRQHATAAASGAPPDDGATDEQEAAARAVPDGTESAPAPAPKRRRLQLGGNKQQQARPPK